MKKVIFLLYVKIVNLLSGKGLSKIPGVVSLFKFFYKIFNPSDVILTSSKGNKIYIDTRDQATGYSYIFKFSEYFEKWETQLFEKLVSPGMIVVNIGANFGHYTLIAAKLCGSDGKVYAFEPEPRSYSLLCKNISINGYENVVPLQKVVSNKNGEVDLFINTINLGNHSLSEHNILDETSANPVKIEAITLDSFFEDKAEGAKIDLIKIDTEGAEGLIIEGAKNILKLNNLKIIMEFWPFGLKNLGTNPLKLLEDLSNQGFIIKVIAEEEECLKQLGVSEMTTLCNRLENERRLVDMLLEKKE